LNAPRFGYSDFVALEQQTIVNERTREFWAQKLEGASESRLPRWPEGMRPGGHEQKRGPEAQISPETLSGLKNLAQRCGVPLKSVLLAAHLKVMSLIHAQNDVVTGLICNGRPEEIDGEKIIGLFLNNVPLRQKLGEGTWRDLVQQTFASEQEIVPHRRFPLAEVKKLTGGRNLFETAFDFVHFHVYKQLQGCRSLDLTEGHYFEANNLTTYTTFMLDVTSTRLELHIDFDPKEICPGQVERMNGYYLNTLRAMAADPEASYLEFCPLSEAERAQLLLEFNQTDREYAADATLSELFERQAAANPKKIALTFGQVSLSYEDLNEGAACVARALADRNIKEQELVGLFVERSPEMVIGLLGILKAGGAYLPLDPSYPRERLTFMLQDSGTKLLLTQRALLDKIPPSTALAICIDDLCPGGKVTAPTPPPESTESESRAVMPDRLAYVIYTSGSTGRPKGVEVTQGAVINLLTSAAHTAGIDKTDHLLAVTTLSFDIAALELFMPLIIGASVTLASREQASDGSQLSALLRSCEPTVMQATPATWRLLIETGWQGNPKLRVFCGGEALKRELADELLARSREVWNFYGPTETTIWSAAWKVRPGEPIAIGRPLANTQMYILNAELNPVPVGAIGELHIGGAGLARGYLNREELTAQRFVSHPFSKQPGDRLYKTGDLARCTPDGTIYCLGRIDQQVKIRGFRIELGEVESALRQHDGIADAVVTARPDGLGENRLIAYLTSKNGPPSVPDLRDFMKGKLPVYMVPAQFVVLKEFPLTPNGKVDVRNLPSPENQINSGNGYVSPRNQEDQRIADIWREVLLVPRIGIDDNFFELGGDSLSATRAFSRTNQAFGTELTLREMLDRPTVRSLSDLVTHSRGTAGVCPPILPRSERRKRLAL
jgi:amino acid adenylation domain-containing protein